ncbi:hypothetical protein STRINF_01345 [Streptococcus infantarius subsp. infantarius ATCC BAA-102]|uniref:DNA alkylation repair protein n=1 Tax=Streptococcus infantarius subsp. infantarius ATCC BAA-102 TaxID=471872 RepID=A0ABP2DJ55_9STRE|nr:hypothetical protein STRINF_01345 [Streptococcus infantarius subsp. infantarius ATCC BAA-102]
MLQKSHLLSECLPFKFHLNRRKSVLFLLSNLPQRFETIHPTGAEEFVTMR